MSPLGLLHAARRCAEFVFGHHPPHILSEPARRAIGSDQRTSEILVCLVQFGAIAFFGAFYALTPKAFPPNVPFAPVPWALALYTVFTGIRLWLAVRDRLSRLFLGLSVVVDISVLMLTIWSFHLQYQQPPAIYLKAPTLLYVFILIALRTMRFEAVYVILAGITAVIGWSVLVAYAVLATNEVRLTHDFATYANSSAILIGAEIDKLLSLTVVTAVLAVTVVRARRLLVRATIEAHAAGELSRFFSPRIADEIRRADAEFRPGDAVMREAAVLILDLRGFTALAARQPPSATMALLAAYQRRIVPVIQHHGGAIDKYLGDGIMATFGAVQPSGTYAAEAFAGLRAVLKAMEDWNNERRARAEEPLGMGAAVTIGPILFGVTGDESRLEFTAIGDAVNVAAKLEKHCKVVGRAALSTAFALARARAQGFEHADEFELLPGEVVAGVGTPLHLVAPRGAPRSTQPHAPATPGEAGHLSNT